MIPTHIIMPTYHGPPHAGHLFNLRSNLCLHKDCGVEGKRFAVVVDNPDYNNIDLADVKKAYEQYVPEYTTYHHLWGYIPKRRMKFDPENDMKMEDARKIPGPLWHTWRKMMWLTDHNVQEMGRGHDLMYLNKWERCLHESYWSYLIRTVMFVHGLIVDEAGNKLSASDGEHPYTEADLDDALAAINWQDRTYKALCSDPITIRHKEPASWAKFPDNIESSFHPLDPARTDLSAIMELAPLDLYPRQPPKP